MSFAHPSLLFLLPVVWVVVILLEFPVPAHRRRRISRTLVRALGLSLLVVAAAGPERSGWRGLGSRLVIAVDRSDAMGLLAREEALAEASRAAAKARSAGAAITLLGFTDSAAPAYELPGAPAAPAAGDGPEADWPQGPGGRWPLPAPGAEATPVREPAPRATARPAAGLTAAHLAFRPGERGTVLLLTTGREGLRGVEEAAGRLAAAGIRLLPVALPREVPPPPPRAEVETIDLPETVRGPFTVHATVRGPGRLEVELLVDGESRGRRTVPNPGADARGAVSFDDLEAEVGLHEVAVVVRRLDGGNGAHATLARRMLTVEPPPRTLAFLEDPDTSPTRQALGAQGFPLVTVPPDALIQVLVGDGPRPEAIVLDAASAASLPPQTHGPLIKAIEGGVGLFLEPGTDEDAWAALADTPLARVLPVTPLKPPEPEPPEPAPETPDTPETPDVDPPDETDDPGLTTEQRPEEALPISLLLVLDRSGSMMGPKFGMALEGARRAAMTLSEFDRLGVVTFAEDATVDVPPTTTRRLGNIAWRLALIQPAGNTDLYGALSKAVQVMEREKAPIRHVIFLTDGRQTGSEPIFGPLMKRMAQAGITLTAVGLGPNHDGRRLKQIVQFSPRGRYIPADTEAQLPTILTRDTQKIAEYRLREAKAMTRLRDPDQKPEPAPVKDDPQPAPPTPPDPVPPEPTPPTPPPVAALARLHLLRPHEATRGLDEETLPSVGPPRASKPRRGAALLMARGESGEPVLAARRVGLGRVMVFTLPADATGLSSWPDLGRVLVQGVRSVRAPRGVFGATPTGRILRGPDGERLALDASSNPGAGPLRVTWKGAEGPEYLGSFLPGQEVRLPHAPPGTPAVVHLDPEDGTPAGPPLTYLAADPDATGPRPGDASALRAAVGVTAVDGDGPLLPPPGREPDPEPLWPWALALAALLLPFDAALHRRCEEDPRS